MTQHRVLAGLTLLLALVGCGEEPPPMMGEVSATFMVDGSPVPVTFEAELAQQGDRWSLSGWSASERYGVVLSWEGSAVSAPGTWSGLVPGAAIHVAIVHPRLDHAEHVNITSTAGGAVTFDHVAGDGDAAVAGSFGSVRCEHALAGGATRVITVDDGTFVATER